MASDSNVSFRHDSAEMDHSENEDITIKRADSTDKVSVTLLGPPDVLQVSNLNAAPANIPTEFPLSPW